MERGTGPFLRTRPPKEPDMQSRSSQIKQLVIFFVLAFLIGWLAFVPVFLYHLPTTPGAFLFLFSPALAALIMEFLAGGWRGIRDMLGRYLLWKFQLRWYLLAFLLLPAIFLIAGMLSPGPGSGSLWTGSPWYFLIASFLFLMFINSGEEIGWRGFALPRLQSQVHSPLAAALILGLVWGLWHLPLYLDPRQSAFPLWLFLLFTMGISILYSVLFNHTRGSLLLAVILHASTDIAPRFLQVASFTLVSWSIVVALTWVSALVLYFVTRTTAPAIKE